MPNKMKKEAFYKMLTEIHNEVSGEECGLAGNYTPENVEFDDTYERDWNKPRINGKLNPAHIASKTPLDYIGNVIRRYIDVE